MTMRATMILALALAAGCASTAPPPPATIHPRFAELRPVMVAVIIETTTRIGPELDAAVRAELIGKNYSPLAPGVEPDKDSGILLVVTTPERAQTTLTAPAGTLLYRMETSEGLEDPAGLAKTLLSTLPPK